jgi:hypothetical protein
MNISPGAMDPKEFKTLAGGRDGDSSFTISAFIASGVATYGPAWQSTQAFQFLTTGLQISLVSSSTLDAAAGTGAITLTVAFLKQDWTLATETITLNGITPVASVGTDYIGIAWMRVKTTGSTFTNQGLITANNGSAIFGYISALHFDSRKSQLWFVVPKNYSAIITSAGARNSTGPVTKANIRISQFYQTGDVENFRSVGIAYVCNEQKNFPGGIWIRERSIVYCDYEVQTLTNGFQGQFTIFMTPN